MSPSAPDSLTLAILRELQARREQDTATIERLTERLIELERENAVRADALELTQAQLDEARAALEARQRADDRPWWRRILGR